MGFCIGKFEIFNKVESLFRNFLYKIPKKITFTIKKYCFWNFWYHSTILKNRFKFCKFETYVKWFYKGSVVFTNVLELSDLIDGRGWQLAGRKLLDWVRFLDPKSSNPARCPALDNTDEINRKGKDSWFLQVQHKN